MFAAVPGPRRTRADGNPYISRFACSATLAPRSQQLASRGNLRQPWLLAVCPLAPMMSRDVMALWVVAFAPLAIQDDERIHALMRRLPPDPERRVAEPDRASRPRAYQQSEFMRAVA
jgi:hypothetical protein